MGRKERRRLSKYRPLPFATTVMHRRSRRGWRKRHFKIQEGRCFYCAKMMLMQKALHPDQLTLDHLVPISRGGADTWDNTAGACRNCNLSKGLMTVDEFRAKRAANASPKPSPSTKSDVGSDRERT